MVMFKYRDMTSRLKFRIDIMEGNMMNEKVFCLTSDELIGFVENDEELNNLLGEKLVRCSASDTLQELRNHPLFLADGDFKRRDFLVEKLSDFIREEFGFLCGYKNLCAEEQLKELLSKVFADLEREAIRYNLNKWRDSQLLDNWERWFVPRLQDYYNRGEVSNEVYETYDFSRSEDAIMHIIDLLKLPPMQEQYVKHYLGLKGGVEVEYTDFETDILMKAGENILLQEPRVCKLLDDILKS